MSEQHYEPIPAYAISADKHVRVLGSVRRQLLFAHIHNDLKRRLL